MKDYTFNINQIFKNKVSLAIRRKEDIIILLMESIRYMLLNPSIKEESTSTMILKIDKMKRLFFFEKTKYFSIIFPFSIKTEGDNLLFYSKYISNIDAKICIDILSLLSCNKSEESTCVTDILEPLTDMNDYHEYIGTLIKELLFMEDGYIRYDYDKEHENGNLHPLNHYDIFYSSHATFKIGLNQKLDESEFIDLLNIKSDCKYLG
ncbi:MAG: hypothetical protein QM493_09390 [Sulfurovum sp.]